ncbi:MAG: 4-(cytidine 5'-diphospho)-2-C-methyl-D-erythritol kinase [Verrucomicrobiota bacterium]|nr:4-(cytidine 5'-diphospho)-2-C-methyl-D-erythritol kinase [Verrucomicrobiota bacterium]
MPEYFSPSKINLYLNIKGKRPDGYHELETLMIPLELGDTMVIEESDSTISMTCNSPEVPCDERNLVWKAIKALHEVKPEAAGRGVKVHLEKRTPVAAGMGGGSANAATAIRALNDIYRLNLSIVEQESIVNKVGSDCAFFIKNLPALCTGRGEIIQSLPLNLDFYIIIINPGFGISTKWSYETLSKTKVPAAPPVEKLINAINENDIKNTQPYLFNSLEFPAFEKYLILPQIKNDLISFGSDSAMMSGSGSTVFALCRDKAAADEVLNKIKSKYGKIIFGQVTKPLSSIV